jgi:hypothetical protein
VQIATVQKILKSFVEKFHNTFDSFIESWIEDDGSQIHGSASPRPSLFGHSQTGFSTFLGLCRSTSRDIEKRGGIFGLYVLSSTQFAQCRPPILVSPGEMRSIGKFCHEDFECTSIITSLIKGGQIAFSDAPTAIRTQYSEFPPAVVGTERIPFTSRFVTSRELEERKRTLPEESDFQSEFAEYRDLMAVIRSESSRSSYCANDQKPLKKLSSKSANDQTVGYEIGREFFSLSSD